MTGPRRSAAWRPSEQWRNVAACAHMGPELFFPVGESTEDALRQTAEAMSVCMQCQVRLHCLVWALVMNPEYGIWGGVPPSERRAIRRYRRSRRQARSRAREFLAATVELS